MYVILHNVLKKPHLFFGLAVGDKIACGAWLSAYCRRKDCLRSGCWAVRVDLLTAGLCRKPRAATDAKVLLEAAGNVEV